MRPLDGNLVQALEAKATMIAADTEDDFGIWPEYIGNIVIPGLRRSSLGNLQAVSRIGDVAALGMTLTRSPGLRMPPDAHQTPGLALVLTGGGARGAYQAGVLQGIADILRRHGRSTSPFQLYAGISAGAINTAFLASMADDFCAAADRLAKMWSELRTQQVFRTDLGSLGRIGMGWVSDLMFGSLKAEKRAKSLLDTAPLRALLRERIDFSRIRTNIDAHYLDAFEVTATNYSNSQSVTFAMTREQNASWQTPRRRGCETAIGVEHIMASAAIPLLFPPVQLDASHYGDGCLRNPAPLSPALRLGAQRLLIVGVRCENGILPVLAEDELKPTIGRILSVLLNAILMDQTEFDIERLARVNDLIEAVPLPDRGGLPLRDVPYTYLQPSADLGSFAATNFQEVPDILRHLISGLGNRAEASELVSYLFFEPVYTRHLVDLGRADAERQAPAIAATLFGN